MIFLFAHWHHDTGQILVPVPVSSGARFMFSWGSSAVYWSSHSGGCQQAQVVVCGLPVTTVLVESRRPVLGLYIFLCLLQEKW
jgi:hypothetical protein